MTSAKTIDFAPGRGEVHTTCIRIETLVRAKSHGDGKPKTSYGYAEVAIGDDEFEDAYIPASVAEISLDRHVRVGGFYKAQVRVNPRREAEQPWMVTRIWWDVERDEDYFEARALPVELAAGS